MRKLASIQRIAALHPIAGKDKIVLAQILGWYVIVKKDEFKVNDLCVFYEIDSFLPVTPEYAFLGKPITFLGKEGYRIKTMKMAGTISQGLALPLRMFTTLSDNYFEGDDVTDLLKVIKYDRELLWNAQKGSVVSGLTKGTFPSFIPKTDQTRIQSLPFLFEQETTTIFEETLKLDGSSCTMYKINKPETGIIASIKRFFGFKTNGTYFGVCSRNLELQRPTTKSSDFWTAAIKYNIEAELPIGYAIQGEVIAPNIQSNHEKVQSVEFYIFDVFDIEKREYLLPPARQRFVEMYLPSANHIPIIDSNFQPLALTMDALVDRVQGQSINPNTVSEGRVYKAIDKHLSFKCISNAYLLKEK